MVSRHAFTRVLQATHMPYESPAGKDFMKDMITMMHLARTEEHFDLMAGDPAVCLGTWRIGLTMVQCTWGNESRGLVRPGVLRGALERVVDRYDC